MGYQINRKYVIIVFKFVRLISKPGAVFWLVVLRQFPHTEPNPIGLEVFFHYPTISPFKKYQSDSRFAEDVMTKDRSCVNQSIYPNNAAGRLVGSELCLTNHVI